MYFTETNTDRHDLRSPAFACLVEHEHDKVVVSLHGELDLATGPGLEARLLRLLELPVSALTLDLRELSFVDTAGLAALIRVDKAARASSIEIAFVEAGPQVSWMLALIGITALSATAS